jgi:hypothetical protein
VFPLSGRVWLRSGPSARRALLTVHIVVAVGALVIDGALKQLREGGDAHGKLIAAASWDVVALTTATVLAVYKPARRMRRAVIRQ